jgi:hypothetical protein
MKNLVVEKNPFVEEVNLLTIPPHDDIVASPVRDGVPIDAATSGHYSDQTPQQGGVGVGRRPTQRPYSSESGQLKLKIYRVCILHPSSTWHSSDGCVVAPLLLPCRENCLYGNFGSKTRKVASLCPTL